MYFYIFFLKTVQKMPNYSVFYQQTVFLRQILWRLSISYILWTSCRIGFYIANKNILPTPQFMEFIWGIRFDTCAILYINALWILLTFIYYFVSNVVVCSPIKLEDWVAPQAGGQSVQNWIFDFFLQKKSKIQFCALGKLSKKRIEKILKIVFILTNCIGLAAEITDIGYFRFANRRTILSDFSLWKNNISMLSGMMLEYWYLSFGFLGWIGLMSYSYDRLEIQTSPIKFRWIPQIFIFILTIGGFIIGARGGLQLRPLTPLNAVDYTHDMRLMPFVSNTTLNLLYATQQRFLVEPNYCANDIAEKIYPIFHYPKSKDSMRPYNVVVIALESFGKEYSGLYTPDYQNQLSGFTPFLDSLANVSYSCSMSYANGLRSTQGIVALTAGLPAFMDDPYMFSAYQTNRLDGLAAHLKQKNYTTAFIHLSNPGSMDFDKYTKSIGFERFYDKRMYPNPKEYDGQWGIWDDPMFQFMADSISQFPEPFYTFCFTLTSHHPYNVPDFFKKQYPNRTALHRSVLYTDTALKHFFEKASKMAWFKNTLFVIAADHTGAGTYIDAYQTKVGRYKIPILFYKPNEISPQQVNRVCQQIDVLPSVLDFLKYDKPYLSFGRSVWSKSEASYAFQYEESLFQIENDKYVLFFDGERVQRVHDLENDPFLQRDLKNNPSVPTDSLANILKSVIQQHHKAMIHNRLTPIR
jgi:phosphoglycerol transferase MdoB-like AlkP superfamily enzyme